MRIALTRPVSAAIERCELTHLQRQPIDLDRARQQHEGYERGLQRLGCEVRRLPEEPDLPDAVFVEDTAVVLDELAVMTRPGAVTRRGETAPVAAALAPHRRLAAIEAPATLDGGDVLVVDRQVYVGRSARSDAAGIGQLREILSPPGYTVTAVAMDGCLHLKSAVTQVAPGLLLVHRPWVDTSAFRPARLVDVDPGEPFAANALRVGARVLFPMAFPRTADRLRAAGLEIVTVDVSELAKAEGAVTCCSLVFET